MCVGGGLGGREASAQSLLDGILRRGERQRTPSTTIVGGAMIGGWFIHWSKIYTTGDLGRVFWKSDMAFHSGEILRISSSHGHSRISRISRRN